jgi:hypothetical protein
MLKKGEIEKEYLGLAGEYAVASELCRRGVWAQVTLAQHKSVDLLVEGGRRTVTVQVKSKQRGQWPRVQWSAGHDHFIVLVDFRDKVGAQPDFYVWNHSDWRRVVKAQMQSNRGLKAGKDWQVTHPDGWKGLNLNVDLVRRSKDKWAKIIQRANGGRTPSAPG